MAKNSMRSETSFSDTKILEALASGTLSLSSLESKLGDPQRAVDLRRQYLAHQDQSTKRTSSSWNASGLPSKNFDWTQVAGRCCENSIGYIPVPVGVAGPIKVDGQELMVPMATTEGALIASTSRGCKAINLSSGVTTVLTGDGMTRAPCVRFSTVRRAHEAKRWIDSAEGWETLRTAFESTSRFARLNQVTPTIAGQTLYIRLRASCGDAMGMNMVSKGAEEAMKAMRSDAFRDMEVISISGNVCTDKKSSAVNWLHGRGKSVVAEAFIPAHVVSTVLKTSLDALVELNMSKNLVGSAVAGSIGGGFNAHAANTVAAVFLATGQDVAQVVESSNCMTLMERCRDSLHITVTMPSIEVGTIGGGTSLEAQGSMLALLGVRGAHASHSGDNSKRLARIIAAVTLASELSTCSALAADHLVTAHMALNRKRPQRTDKVQATKL